MATVMEAQDDQSKKQQPSPENIGASFESCLKLMKSKDDNSKFAGLLLVTKLIKPDESDNIKKVFHALGFEFLDRLLLTSTQTLKNAQQQTATADSSSQQEMATVYLSLCMNILSSFCTVEELALDPRMLKKIPTFSAYLKSTEDLHLAHSCLQCLAYMAKYAYQKQHHELVHLLLSQCVGNLTTLFKHAGTITTQTRKPPTDKPAEQPETNTEEQIKEETSLSILNSTLDLIALIQQPTKDLDFLISELSAVFSSNHPVKFRILQTLLTLLSNSAITDSLKLSSKPPLPVWAHQIRIGLFSIFSSRMTAQHRDPAIHLAAAMWNLFGSEWVVMTLPEEIKAPYKIADRSKFGLQFFELLFQLATIEVRLILDAKAAYHDPFKSEEKKPVKQPQDIESGALVLLMSCYAIVERSIEFMASQMDEIDSPSKQITLLPNATIERLHKSFTDLFHSVFLFLEFCQDNIGNPKLAHPIDLTEPAIVATLRVLCCWVAEETSTPDAFANLLPLFFKIQDANPSLDVFGLLIPGLLVVTTEEKTCSYFLKMDGHVRLAHYIRSNEAVLLSKIEAASWEHPENVLGVLLNLVCGGNLSPDQVAAFIEVLPSLGLFAAKLLTSDPSSNPLDTLTNVIAAIMLILRPFTEKEIMEHLKQYSDQPANVYHSLVQYTTEFYANIPKDALSETLQDLYTLGIHAISSSLSTLPYLAQSIQKAGLHRLLKQ